MAVGDVPVQRPLIFTSRLCFYIKFDSVFANRNSFLANRKQHLKTKQTKQTKLRLFLRVLTRAVLAQAGCSSSGRERELNHRAGSGQMTSWSHRDVGLAADEPHHIKGWRKKHFSTAGTLYNVPFPRLTLRIIKHPVSKDDLLIYL